MIMSKMRGLHYISVPYCHFSVVPQYSDSYSSVNRSFLPLRGGREGGHEWHVCVCSLKASLSLSFIEP